MFHAIKADIAIIEGNPIMTVLSNRGFHALLFYRIAHWLWVHRIPVFPMVLTRFIQILYAIDIDWRAKIEGGCTIVHGVGLVIGMCASVGAGTKLYHGVTLGIAHSESNDGYPVVGRNVLIGAGAKVLGHITIGDGAKIGANAVVLQDVPAYAAAVGVPAKVIQRKLKVMENAAM